MVNWRKNLWIIWIAQILSVAGINFASPFLPYFIQEIGITEQSELKLWAGIIASAPALTMAIMAPIWGLLSDRIGKKIMLLRAMFFGSLILIGIGLSHSITAVIVLRLLQGLLAETMTASAILVSAHTPKDKLSYALGMISASSFIGMSAGPLFGGFSADLLGYRFTFFIGACILAIGFFLVLFAVKEDRSASLSQREEGESPKENNNPGTIVSISILGAFVIIFILRFSRMLPLAFIPLHVQNILETIEGAPSITGLISFGRGAATALASITIVRLGDRYPRMGIITLLLGLSACMTFPVLFTGNLIGFSAFFILATFFLGGIEPLLQSEIISNVPNGKQGLVFGIQTTVSNLGWCIAPIVGSLITIRWGISSIFLIVVISLAVAMVFSLLVISLLKDKNYGTS